MPLGNFDVEKVEAMDCDHRAAALRVKTVAVIAVAMGFGLAGAGAVAQTAGPAPASASAKPAAAPAAATAAPKKNPETALKAYGAGTRAFEQGKMTDAVVQLSTALSAGGLPSNQMAKALYYRGAAYRKQGKPAMAISDLTSALWLKGGLNDSDRALAVDARQGAYREAGLGDTAPAIPAQQTAAVATPAASAAATGAPAAAPAQTAAAVAPAEGGATLSWQQATGATSEPVATLGSVPEAPRAAPPAKAVASAPLDNSLSSFATVGASAPETAAAAPYVTSAPAAASAPVLSAVEPEGTVSAPITNPLAGTGQAVAGFFNNMGTSIGKMFGGGTSTADAGSQATQTASSPVMTSSTGPVYANTPATGAEPAAWGEAVVKAPKVASKAAAQAQQQPAPAAKQQVASAGGILLQVAAVRSREEADVVSTRLRGTPAVVSAGKQASIDEAVIGNMGTFYRVRLGPFANAAEPGKLCAVLKPEGYDCLVVSQ